MVPTGLLPVWLGLRSKGKNEFTSILPSLPVRSGPTHDTGRRRQPEFLAVVTLRVIGVTNTGGFSLLTEVNPCQLEGAYQP